MSLLAEYHSIYHQRGSIVRCMEIKRELMAKYGKAVAA